MYTSINPRELDNMLSLVMNQEIGIGIGRETQELIDESADRFFADNEFKNVPDRFLHQYENQWYVFYLEESQGEKHFLSFSTVLQTRNGKTTSTAIRDVIQHLYRTREDCRADGYDWTPSLGQVIDVLEAYCKQAGGTPEPDDNDDDQEGFDLMEWGVTT